ncbi:MAG: Maf family nucleotide pyrophosphatase [Pseudomonadota bacterium]
MASSPKLVLASASPRRLDLLQQIHITPDLVLPADIDETAHTKELPRDYVTRIACAKAQTVLNKPETENSYILAADTTVACGRRILPKAEDEATARQCLKLLSGRRHRIYGGIALITPDGRLTHRVVLTTVSFKRLHRDDIESYIQSKEWHGKAGGYAIQGFAATFVTFLQGSYTNVVGLSLYDSAQLLNGQGYITNHVDRNNRPEN